MLMEWKTSLKKMSFFPELSYRLKAIQIKTPAGLFPVDTEKTNSAIYVEMQRAKNS